MTDRATDPDPPLPTPGTADVRTDTLPGILEHLFLLVGVLDRDGIVLDINRALLDASGLAAADVLGRRFDDCPWWSADADAAHWLGAAVGRAAAGEVTRRETQLRVRPGTVSSVDVIVAPWRQAAEIIDAVIVLALDITAQREAEHTRRNHESLFRQVVESAPNGLLMVDRDGRIVLMNAAAEQMFGFSRDELMGHPVERLVPMAARADHAAHRQAFQTGATRRAMGAGRDLHARRRDGSEFPVEIGLNPIVTDAGEWVLSAILDVSARKSAQEAQERALEEKTALLNEVHHRVKNNLQVVSSLLNLQAQHAAPDVRAALEVSQGRLRAMALIHQLLYESRDYRSVHLGLYFRRLGQLLREVHGGVRSGVALSFDGLDAPVHFDLTRAVPCGLIVTELVTNAYKHAFPDGRRGTLSVQMRVEPEAVLLIVADDGIGLPGGFRMQGVRSLGYQLVPELVEQARGTLAIGDGPGTRVEVRLRLEPPIVNPGREARVPEGREDPDR